MAKMLHDDVYDFGLNTISTRCTRMAVLTATAGSATLCEAATALAVVSMVSSNYTIQDGATSGRRITVAQMTTIAVGATGVASVIALFSTGATGTIYVETTCATQALTSTNNTITVPSFSIELADPT